MIPASLDSLLHDVRYAVRSLRRTPGFAIVTVLTLAIAIGANSSVFTLVDVLLLRKLPVRSPDELVQISLLSTNGDRAGLSLPLEVRSDGDLSSVQSGIAHAIDSLGREYVTRIQTMDDVIDLGLIAERLSAGLTGFFALVALALAAIGLFALMSYVTMRRTHEIGIRLALGADPRKLKLAVVRESVTLVAAGVAIGVPSAIAAARVIASRLVNLSPHDPLTLVAVSVTMLLVGAAAGYAPARRASRVDPMIALRFD